MKPKFFLATRLSFPLVSAIATMLAANSALGQTTRYWDENGTASGFGTASSTNAWQTGTVSRWSTSSAGTGTPGASITTAINDPLHFGTDSAGLGGGTITVSGTVNAASLRFGSSTTGNITLSGGTINLAATTSIHVGAGSTTVHNITSSITGAATSLTKTGNALQLSGSNSYTGQTIISAGTLILNNTTALGGATPGVNGTSSISMAAGTTLRANLTGFSTSAPITLSGTGTVTIATSTISDVTASFKGGITGTTNNLTFSVTNNTSNPTHIIELDSTSNYSGSTTITVGNAANNLTVKSEATNALSATTVLTMNGGSGSGSGRALIFDLNGNNQTLAGLNTIASYSSSTARNQRITSVPAATLTIDGSTDSSYGGVGTSTVFNSNPVNPTATITGAISLVKNGASTFTLGPVGMSYTGSTRILGGILSLSHANNMSSSSFDTDASIAGNTTNGLRITTTTLTLGALTGSNDFSTRFTTTSGGYSGLTALTLNPGASVTHSYSGDIGDGAGGMTLTKMGAGTQILNGTNTHTGTTSISAGTLVLEASGTISSSTLVSVQSGATLDVSANGFTIGSGKTLRGTGSVLGAVNASSGSIITGGNGTIGTLTVGNLTFGSSGGDTATVNVGTLSGYTTNAAINTTGILTLNGGAGNVTINLPTASISSGTYRLIQFGSGISDVSGFSLGTTPALTGRQSAGTLSLDGGYVTYTLAAASVFWTGNQSSEWSTNAITPNQNWQLTGPVPTDFMTADDVVFNDSAALKTVDISNGDVSPASVTFNNSTGNDYTLTGANGITGTTALNKSNTGTVTITNANTYTGTTTITGGTLQLGDGTNGNDGTIASTSGVTNNGTLVFNRFGASNTVSFAISGSGSVIKKGVGTQTFSVANSHIGGLTVQEGIAILGNTAAAGTGTISFSNGGLAAATVQLNIGATTMTNPIAVSASSTNTNTITNIGTGAAKLDGAMVIDTGATLTFDSSSSNNSAFDIGAGGITGDGSVAATGTSTGNFIFRGLNTYSGGTSLSGAGIFVPATSSTGSGAGTTDGVFGTGSLTLNSISMRSTTVADTTIGNSLVLNGNLTAITTSAEKSLIFRGPATLTASRNITSNVGNTVASRALIFSGNIGDGGNGFGITKEGTGNMILTGASSYSGPTVINAGTLQLGDGTDGNDGTINSTSSVANNATLVFNRFGTSTASHSIDGSGLISKLGAGTQILSGGGASTGNLRISSGTVRVGVTNGIPTTAGLDIAANAPISATLDLNGLHQTLSSFVHTAADAGGNLTITGGAGSKLTVTTATDTEIGAGGFISTAGRDASVDMSGLGEFVWNGASNTFRVGLRTGATNASSTNPGVMSTTLAGTNSITAAILAIGNVPASNNGATSNLQLGQSNLINASTINMGNGGRNYASLNFNTGLTNPSATFRSTNGTSPITSWDIGRVGHTANVTYTSVVDFSAGQLDAKVTTLRMGRADALSSTGRAGTQNSSFSMSKGTLDVTTLMIGQYAGLDGSTLTGSAVFSGNGTFTLSDATGTVKAEDIILADNVGLATGGVTRSTSGTFNLTDGTLEAKTIGKGDDTGNATATTRTFNFASGTIRNYASSNLTISHVPITLTGTGTRVFEATAGQSITLASTSAIGDGGNELGFTKEGEGTLTLSGVNTYTGTTSVAEGTLALVGGSQASPITVSSGASLGFTLNSSTTSTSTFNLSAGTIKITGTPTLPSYDLITSSTGITGTPVLHTPIDGYELEVVGNSLKLVISDLYVAWTSETFANPFTETELTDNPDGDAYNNLQEYAFGMDPTVVNTAPIAYLDGDVTAPGAPLLLEEDGFYYAVFGRRSDYDTAGLTYTVEFSAGLEQWTASAAGLEVIATDGTIDAIRIPFPSVVATPSGPKKPHFFKVTVTK